MWLATSKGFFSVVKKENSFYVRARNVTDLKILLSATGLKKEILQLPKTDYIARIIVNQDELNLIMQTLTDTIDYDNFKDSVYKNKLQKDKSEYYSEIWWMMVQYQMTNKNRTTKKANK